MKLANASTSDLVTNLQQYVGLCHCQRNQWKNTLLL